jgi:hypothetical protein
MRHAISARQRFRATLAASPMLPRRSDAYRARCSNAAPPFSQAMPIRHTMPRPISMTPIYFAAIIEFTATAECQQRSAMPAFDF